MDVVILSICLKYNMIGWLIDWQFLIGRDDHYQIQYAEAWYKPPDTPVSHSMAPKQMNIFPYQSWKLFWILLMKKRTKKPEILSCDNVQHKRMFDIQGNTFLISISYHLGTSLLVGNYKIHEFSLDSFFVLFLLAYLLGSPECSDPHWLTDWLELETDEWLNWHSALSISGGTFSPKNHDDVIKRKHFPRYWPFEGKIHRSPVNYPHKGQ